MWRPTRRPPFFLVLREDGTPFDRNALSWAWNRARDSNPALMPLNEAGLVVHGLRSTAVVRARQRGATVLQISSMFGMSERWSRAIRGLPVSGKWRWRRCTFSTERSGNDRRQNIRKPTAKRLNFHNSPVHHKSLQRLPAYDPCAGSLNRSRRPADDCGALLTPEIAAEVVHNSLTSEATGAPWSGSWNNPWKI